MSKRYKTNRLSVMFTILHKIDCLHKAIEIVLSKNRHIFLVEDFELLQKCLNELSVLKEEIISCGCITEKSQNQLEQIIKLLDVFFGLAENILDYFEELN